MFFDANNRSSNDRSITLAALSVTPLGEDVVMVAITTDSPQFQLRSQQPASAPVLSLAPAGPVDSLSPLGRLLLVLAAAAVVVAVAVASAAFGRVLDTHRGIPEVGSQPEVAQVGGAASSAAGLGAP